ncbi:MAG TPA: AGE family epimerase/isomerase [Caulobacteraceae bacterium]|nr:AGE family epimerase/isomerase [Caulobacteraceae bacterium]
MTSDAIPFDRVRAWLFDEALPFWSTVGVDGDRGFVERMDLDGTPADVDFKRMRVQARQIYVFSHAATLGFEGGLAAARNGYDFITTHGRLPGGGWARTLGRQGGMLDPAMDLYDLAFVIFALGWYWKASGDETAARLAVDTLEAVDRQMAAAGGGYVSELPDPGVRLQNPHMHLLEALAASPLRRDGAWREATLGLTRLFRERLYDPATGTLAETFDEDWRRAVGPAGVPIECGHHFEWCWLLRRADRRTGEDHGAERERLFAFAERHGVRSDGMVVDEVSETGARIGGDTRLWAQAERLKALLDRAEHDGVVDRAGVAACATNLLDRFLAPAPRACWIDHLTADGAPRVDKIPASSLYHLFLAFAELLRLQPVLEGRP